MNDDLISRAAAIEILMKYCPDDDGTCSKADADPREMLDEIENISAVDAEPVRHGKWDSFGVRTTDHKGRKRIEYFFNACTVCEQGAITRTAFCPNCGAKMDLEVES